MIVNRPVQSPLRLRSARQPRLRAIALFCAAASISVNVAQAQSALSAEGQAWLRTTIASGHSDLRWPDFSDYSKHLNKFYINGDSLWWVRAMEPTPQARQAIALLLQANQKGLSAADYDGDLWSGRLAKLKPATRQPVEADALKFDLALTVSVMRYISDLHIGKVNPKHFAFALDEEPRKYDLPEYLKDRVVDANDVAAVLAEVEPPYPGYRNTVAALQTYMKLAAQDDGEQLPAPAAPKKAIAPGDTYPGVPRLTRLLRLVGDLRQDANIPLDSQVYDGPLADAVKSFQSRHGRNPSGRIDAQTLADLNVPLRRRVQQMQWTLERWRWLPDSYQRAPIVANIPEFRLRAYDKDFNIGVTMKVVVGKSYGHNTPVSSETLQQLRAGKLFIRQLPGPKNSLGLVKFLFPNSYNVYMHDTPAQEFFAQSRRDFSHGCIRLEKPADLAAWVLRNNPGWTPERIHAAMNGDAPQQVNLAQPIPVLIVYGTVIVLSDGVVHFYDDIYGHDASLEKVLAKGYPFPG